MNFSMEQAFCFCCWNKKNLIKNGGKLVSPLCMCVQEWVNEACVASQINTSLNKNWTINQFPLWASWKHLQKDFKVVVAADDVGAAVAFIFHWKEFQVAFELEFQTWAVFSHLLRASIKRWCIISLRRKLFAFFCIARFATHGTRKTRRVQT